MPFLILFQSVYVASLFVLNNNVIENSLSEIVGDDKISFLVSYIVSLHIVPVFRGGSRSDQSDHATKVKWKKNSPGVKLRAVHYIEVHSYIKMIEELFFLFDCFLFIFSALGLNNENFL